MLAISLPAELEERLERIAKETCQTAELCARRVILDHLEDLEDAEAAEKALDEFYASGEKAIPLEEVMKLYGLESSVQEPCPEPATPSR